MNKSVELLWHQLTIFDRTIGIPMYKSAEAGMYTPEQIEDRITMRINEQLVQEGLYPIHPPWDEKALKKLERKAERYTELRQNESPDPFRKFLRLTYAKTSDRPINTEVRDFHLERVREIIPSESSHLVQAVQLYEGDPRRRSAGVTVAGIELMLAQEVDLIVKL